MSDDRRTVDPFKQRAILVVVRRRFIQPAGIGGGILIRSIIDANATTNEKKGLIIGPLTCKDVILNACKGGKMPEIEPLNNKRYCKPTETYRYLGNNDFEEKKTDGNLKLAYYDSLIEKEVWEMVRSSYYSKRLQDGLVQNK